MSDPRADACRFSRAVARRPGPDFAGGITAADLGPPEYDRILRQHDAYLDALRLAGLDVAVLEPLTGFPDAYFPEDAAVVFPEAAVITRPGAEARRGETPTIEEALRPHRRIERIEPPGTIDGGDVFRLGGTFFVGISGRTDRAGAEALGAIVERYGYAWAPVPVREGLHLRSGANPLGPGTVLLHEVYRDEPAFRFLEKVFVELEEGYGANALRVNDTILIAAGFPRLRERIERLGAPVIPLGLSEPRKMDGGLTCMSLRF
ncbi:MAG: amidinotransferase [Candidatus Eisenbacteria bacterium]|nr:amidinotransferase [Candidatus Eisenbacteria bacterium]